jgi:hypothetical protein
LTAPHQHALLKTKGQKPCKTGKYYSKYILKFDIRTLLDVLKLDIHTSLNVLKVTISNLSMLSEVRKSDLSTYWEYYV